MRPSVPTTERSASPWRWPISQSAGSCAGVTLTTPVPKLGSTAGSAMTGSCSVPDSVSTASVCPTRWRARAAEAGGRRRQGPPAGVPPLPDPAFELLASQRPARLGPAELPLDHHLGGDPRMVGPRHPERRPAVHAVVPGKDVLEGAVEGV